MANLDVAEDPVCGKVVGLDSWFRVEYYGKVLYFCSDACADQFMEDPMAFEGDGTVIMAGGLGHNANPVRKLPPPVQALPGQQAPRLPAKPAAPPRKPVVIDHDDGDSPSADLTIASLPSQRRGAASVPAAPASAPAASHAPPHGAVPDHPFGNRIRERAVGYGGAFGWLRNLLVQRRETGHLRKVSREMLASFREINARNRSEARRDTYRTVVMRRLGSDEAGAERLLQQASNSFASWPTQRALMLRDVIHFVAVLEYLVHYSDAAGLMVDAGSVVSDEVPADL